jgi:acyl-coenzyme A thioesterase PaaI-like protein
MSSSKQGFYSKFTLPPWLFRLVMNCWPPFWGTRIHIEYIAPNWRQIRLRMKLSMRNKNFVGTQFGGGLFAMVDPFYMVPLLHVLGNEYLVWDKASSIQFIAPGRTTVRATIDITDAMLAEIVAATASGEKFEPTYQVDIVDEQGKVIARVDKTLYIRKKRENVAGVA